MRSPSAGVRQSVIFFLGLLAGVWIVIAPWVLGYPQDAGGRWTVPELTSVVVGGIVAAVSAVCLVVGLTQSAHLVVRQVDERSASRAASSPVQRPGPGGRP